MNSLQDVIYRLEKVIQTGATDKDGMHPISAERVLEELKSITDRPQGKWIIEIDVNGNTYGKCSICGMKQYAGQLNFCPNCGAEMKGVGDESTDRLLVDM